MAWYEYLYPNGYDTMLLSPQPGKVLTAAGILLGFVAVVVAGGSFLFVLPQFVVRGVRNQAGL